MRTVENYDIKKASFYRTGGIVSCIYFPQTEKELSDIFTTLNTQGQSYFILGSGSNLIISESYFEGSVISLKLMDGISTLSDNIIKASAGCLSTTLSLFCKKQSLSGCEWMYLLPGSIGGATYMNAGCYGGSMDKVVEAVNYYDTSGNLQRSLDPFIGYRSSIFSTMDSCVISSVEFRLNLSNLSKIDSKMREVQISRISKNQFKYPSCGCMFKNDYLTEGLEPTLEKKPASYLLDKASLKGKRQGGAFVSQYHANFVFNNKGTSLDILQLAFLMQDTVYDMFGVWLEFEARLAGNFDSTIKERFGLKKEFNLEKYLKALSTL